MEWGKLEKHWWIALYSLTIPLLFMMVNTLTPAIFPVGSYTRKGERAVEWGLGATMVVTIFKLVFQNQSKIWWNWRTMVAGAGRARRSGSEERGAERLNDGMKKDEGRFMD
jgi:hypothetical protein